MPEYLTPGVYVEEFEIGAKPIEGVSTSTAGFLGEAERGSTYPQLVTSFPEYKRLFGGFFGDTKYLPYAVDGFFGNGGKRAFIARIVDKEAALTAGGRPRVRADCRGGRRALGQSGRVPDQARVRRGERLPAAAPLLDGREAPGRSGRSAAHRRCGNRGQPRAASTAGASPALGRLRRPRARRGVAELRREACRRTVSLSMLVELKRVAWEQRPPASRSAHIPRRRSRRRRRRSGRLQGAAWNRIPSPTRSGVGLPPWTNPRSKTSPSSTPRTRLASPTSPMS